jgi:hypothetical protein
MIAAVNTELDVALTATDCLDAMARRTFGRHERLEIVQLVFVKIAAHTGFPLAARQGRPLHEKAVSKTAKHHLRGLDAGDRDPTSATTPTDELAG